MPLPQYNPKLTPLDTAKFIEKLKYEPSFKKVFSIDLTEIIEKEAKEKIDPKFNYENHFMAVCFGGTGKGKSIAMQSFARKIFPDMKVDNIFFHNQQIINSMETWRRPDFIIRDENIDFANFGSGSGRIKAQIEAISHTLRKRGVSFIFIGVECFDLKEVAHYYFEAIDMDLKRRLTRFGVIDPQTNKYLGAIYINVMSETDPFWIKYQEKKEEFIESIINMDFSKGKLQYNQFIEKLLKDIDLSVYKKKKERKIYIKQKFTYLTNTEIDDLSTLLELALKKNGELSESN